MLCCAFWSGVERSRWMRLMYCVMGKLWQTKKFLVAIFMIRIYPLSREMWIWRKKKEKRGECCYYFYVRVSLSPNMYKHFGELLFVIRQRVEREFAFCYAKQHSLIRNNQQQQIFWYLRHICESNFITPVCMCVCL